MNRALWIPLALAALALGGCPSTTATRPGEPAGSGRTVVVLSLDGFRHDYPERQGTPGFDRLATEGARVRRLIPCYPSQTFPAHACLATGARVDRHGIVNNAFLDRERGLYRYANEVTWYDTAPLWIVAQRQGVPSHVVHWIGSQGSYDGVTPAFSRAFEADVTDADTLAMVTGWLTGPDPPGLVMTYLHGCDGAGHDHGPDSPQVEACIARVDGQMSALLATLTPLRDRVTLLVVSDHGMTATVGRLDPWQAVAPAGPGVEVVATGPVAHVYLPPGSTADAAVDAALERLPHVTRYRGDALPPALRYGRPGRTGDRVLVADWGYHFARAEDGQGLVWTPSEPRGHHGHDPQRPEMGAILFAWGAGIRPGARLDTARSVDVAPTVCRLLDIAPPTPTDGAPLEALLDP